MTRAARNPAAHWNCSKPAAWHRPSCATSTPRPTSPPSRPCSAELGIGPRQLLRTGEDEYKDLNLADPALTDAQLIEAMARHPKLIERPILVAGDKAVVGRPPEKVLEILP
ncbi:ArsC/Spx/MgsR family protein [Pseudomonas sp. TE21394]